MNENRITSVKKKYIKIIVENMIRLQSRRESSEFKSIKVNGELLSKNHWFTRCFVDYECYILFFHYINKINCTGRRCTSSGRWTILRPPKFYHSGHWGTVCDDHWTINEAKVVCFQLGFSGATQARCCTTYGQGSCPIWIDNANC